MSNQEQTNDLAQDELATLKARAEQLGISYHPNIGVDSLRKRINDHLSDEPAEDKAAAKKAKPVVSEKDRIAAQRRRKREEALQLVRIRLTCMNPAKREWEGEIITAGNSLVGTVKKYVPFNAEEGWHVPRVIYNVLRDRMCQVFVNERTKNGVSVRRGKLIKEFAIEVLPDLTEKELKELARRQAMAKGKD